MEEDFRARAKAHFVRLLEQGYFVPALRYPTVKKGHARFRIGVSAAHTREDCEGLMKVLRAAL